MTNKTDNRKLTFEQVVGLVGFTLASTVVIAGKLLAKK